MAAQVKTGSIKSCSRGSPTRIAVIVFDPPPTEVVFNDLTAEQYEDLKDALLANKNVTIAYDDNGNTVTMVTINR